MKSSLFRDISFLPFFKKKEKPKLEYGNFVFHFGEINDVGSKVYRVNYLVWVEEITQPIWSVGCNLVSHINHSYPITYKMYKWEFYDWEMIIEKVFL